MDKEYASGFLKGWLLGSNADPELKDAVLTLLEPRKYVTLENHRKRSVPPELQPKSKEDRWLERAPKIRALIEQHGLTDVDLGNRFHVSAKTIGQMRKRFGIPNAKEPAKKTGENGHKPPMNFESDNLEVGNHA